MNNLAGYRIADKLIHTCDPIADKWKIPAAIENAAISTRPKDTIIQRDLLMVDDAYLICRKE